jgi:hypothetical protein
MELLAYHLLIYFLRILWYGKYDILQCFIILVAQLWFCDPGAFKFITDKVLKFIGFYKI